MTTRNKLYLTIILIIALLAGGGYASWLIFGLIVNGSEKIVKLGEEQSGLEAQKNLFQDMTKHYESLKDSIPQIEAVLLDPNDKLKFIMLVEQLSAKTSVDHVIEAVVSPAASGKEKAPVAETITFNINVAGDFTNVLRFIYALESSPYYVNVDKVQLSEGSLGALYSSQAPAGAGVVKAQMSIKVYSKNETDKN